jgi:hypothetical protein
MDIATRKESTMLKKILLAVGSTAALGLSTAALANPPYWAPAYGWHEHEYEHWHHHHRGYYYYAPAPVVVVPAPRVVYAPPPPVAYPYYAAPVAVAPAPAAVIAAPIAPGVSIRLRFPL